MSFVEVIQTAGTLVELVVEDGPAIELVTLAGPTVEVMGTGAQGIAGEDGNAGMRAVTAEVPAGIKDGVNPDFTLAHTPIFLILSWGGIVQSEGADFTRAGPAIHFLRPGPMADDVFAASYIW